MGIHPTLSAPLPWLTAVSRILIRKKYAVKKRGSIFILPRTLSFTKEGKRYIAILFVIGIAAINTGNNLLYLIVAMMLSIIVISGILSESTLRGIEVSRALPRHIFAGRPVMVRQVMSNQKRLFSSFSVSIEELPNNGFTAEPIYTIKLPARGSFTKICSYTFHRRGLHRLEGFKVSTRFPFGFFTKGRRLSLPVDVLVYPYYKPAVQVASSKSAGHELSHARFKGHGTNLYSLRDYTLMDDSRFIHWKSTAKTTRLMTKEFEKEENKIVKIVFHNALTSAADFKDRFEDMVEEAAGLADSFIRSGFEVGFKSLTSELPCKAGKEQLYRILRELALIEPVATNENISPAIKVVKQ